METMDEDNVLHQSNNNNMDFFEPLGLTTSSQKREDRGTC